MGQQGRPVLARINTSLLVLIIVVNSYVIGAPFAPALFYKWQDHNGKREQLAQVIHKPTRVSPKGNQLVVPSMLLNDPILEGPVAQQYKILDQGIWHYAKSSTPDKGSNTVLIGHRFTYTNPKGVFYHLDKVHIGDEIGIHWDGKQYIYRVSEIRQVPPTETSIQDPTNDARLTLFTCTPLWLPKDRLVVVANLESNL